MIEGSIVALITPFRADGSVDYECLAKLVDYHISEGTNAIVSVGTTGESATLTPEEHIEVIRKTIDYANRRIPVIAGTGSNATHEAIEFSKEAARAGADATLLVVPYYNKPTQDGLYQHFSAIAKAVAIPHILYNVPGRCVTDMRIETTMRLARIPNIIGIKDATNEIDRGHELIEEAGSDLIILSGEDGRARELIQAGAKGVISVTANIAPAMMVKMCQAARNGDNEEALRIDQLLTPLHKSLFIEPNPIPVKWAAHHLGLCENVLRLPLTPLTEESITTVRTSMKAIGLST